MKRSKLINNKARTTEIKIFEYGDIDNLNFEIIK